MGKRRGSFHQLLCQPALLGVQCAHGFPLLALLLRHAMQCCVCRPSITSFSTFRVFGRLSLMIMNKGLHLQDVDGVWEGRSHLN